MFQGEVVQRQGTWVRRFLDWADAAEWVYARAQADAPSRNPVRRSAVLRVRPHTAERWGTERAYDVRCLNAECYQPVAASVGIHFDCRG